MRHWWRTRHTFTVSLFGLFFRNWLYSLRLAVRLAHVFLNTFNTSIFVGPLSASFLYFGSHCLVPRFDGSPGPPHLSSPAPTLESPFSLPSVTLKFGLFLPRNVQCIHTPFSCHCVSLRWAHQYVQACVHPVLWLTSPSSPHWTELLCRLSAGALSTAVPRC